MIPKWDYLNFKIFFYIVYNIVLLQTDTSNDLYRLVFNWFLHLRGFWIRLYESMTFTKFAKTVNHVSIN